MFSSEFCEFFQTTSSIESLWTTPFVLFLSSLLFLELSKLQERKYQLRTIFMLLGLFMVTAYISIFASCKPILFKFSFNSINISDFQFHFPVSKNITTISTFSPSKYNLIIKLILETGLANRLLMYASAWGIALENNRTVGVYNFIPEKKSKSYYFQSMRIKF